MIKIAVLDDYQGIAESFADWKRIPPEASVEFLREHLPDEDSLAAALADYEVILTIRERNPIPGSLLRRLPNLKLLVVTGNRFEVLDRETAAELGITIANSTGTVTTTAPLAHERQARAPRQNGGGSTGELTWALIFAIMRNIPREAQSVREGGWQTTIGPDLGGKTLGLVGLGNIGAGVARVGHAFGINVIAWSQNLTPQRAAEHGVTAVSKDELFSTSDIISVHYTLSDRSRGIVGAADLARMKPSAYFVNTSRGPLVDEEALIDTLRNRRIAGAALDVFSVEPLPQGHPFRTLDNVIATPHIGYVTSSTYTGFYTGALERILEYLAAR